MATYEHNGVTVELDEARPEFKATINGKFVRKPSLAAMRRAMTRRRRTVSSLLRLGNGGKDFVRKVNW